MKIANCNILFKIVKTNIGDTMISNYEIRNINGEEILYLYFDIDSEFGKFNNKGNIKNKIKEFIEKNKIAFKGTTVALVVSGMLIGNVVLDNNIDVKPIQNESNIVEVASNPIEDLEGTIEKVLETDKKEDILVEEPIVARPIEETINPALTNKEEVKTNVVTEPKVEAKEEIKEVVDTNTYVKIKRSSGIVTLELEEYIIGVVGAEMPASFNKEALKAQAVVARTYALKAMATGRTLTDNSSTQNYKDNNQLKSSWGSSYDTYYNKVKNAVMETKGLYLTYNGQYIEALYHSTSNGKTENSENVWGNSYPYLVSVSSEYDSSNPSFIKEQFISYIELSSKLKMEVNDETEFNILNKTIGDRVSAIEINGKIYKGVDFRNLLGLRSADFEITKSDNGVTFKTKGYGHGVGMSQYGANGMAKAGYGYESILKHYYTGVSINHL